MKFFFKDKKSKIIFILLLFLIGVISTTCSILNWYLIKVTPKVYIVIENKLEKTTYEIITNEVNTQLVTEKNLKDILIITKNDEGEILSVDFNLEKAYSVNNMINNSIINSIDNLDAGDFENTEFKMAKNSMYIDVPLFIASEYVIISSLGPDIPIRVDFIGTVVTNLKTKITSYGLNNVLNELYVSVQITQLITTPVTEKEVQINYDILIDATLINGRVPSFYGGELIKEGSILNQNIE